MMEAEWLSKSVEMRRGKYRWQPNRESHVVGGLAQGLKEYNQQLHIQDDWGCLGGFLGCAAVRGCAGRGLTNANDILFAINGVLEAMKDVTGQFISAYYRSISSKLFCGTQILDPSTLTIQQITAPLGQAQIWQEMGDSLT
jgi:hypothetical protein